MAKISPIKAPPKALSRLQQTFCLIKMAGEIFVLETAQISQDPSVAGAAELQFYRPGAAKLLMTRYLETQPFTDKSSDVIINFMVSPNTTVYDRIAFSPLATAPTTLNLWQGCTITPARGDWLIIQRFLLEVICDGDIGLYRYVTLFLAHMLQKPEEKPGVMVVLLGGQGIGKGGFFRLLQALWPHTALLVSDIGNVLGQFNAQIERSYVISMDEALFVGDKRSADRLKSFVTEPSITIEQKYQPRRTIDSYHRLFAASNHAHFAQVDSDDRRFLFLRVSELRKGDTAYWEQYHVAIADPAVLAAIVNDLQNYDITTFNPRVRPTTAAHTDQKVRSLSGFNRFWNEVLQTSMIDYGDPIAGPLILDGDTFISSRRLMNAWQAYESRGRSQFTPPQEREMHEALSRLCPSAKRHRKLSEGCQQRGYDLPPLPLARAEFANFLGGDVPWSD